MLGLSLVIGGMSQALCGMVHSFPILGGMRVVHGAMNSAVSPLSYSLVADYIPPERRATANSILATAIYAGISLSSLSVLLIKRAGWAWTFKFMGIAGVILGIVTALTMKEPKKGEKMYETINQTPQEEDKSVKQKEPFSWKKVPSNLYDTFSKVLINPTSRWVTVAACFRTLGGIAVATYLPIFFLKNYPEHKN